MYSSKLFFHDAKVSRTTTTNINRDWNNVYGVGGSYQYDFLHVHSRKTLATHPKIINEPPIVRNGRHPPKNSGMFSFLCVMHAMAKKMNPNGSKIVFLNGIVTVKSS